MDRGEAQVSAAAICVQVLPDTLLDRLCKHLVVEKAYAVLAIPEGEGLLMHGVKPTDGFEWQVARIPELVPLAEHFDRILVRGDAYSFEVICIKDRLTDSSRRVSMNLETLVEVGKQCLRYTGKMHGAQLPVTMKVWEVCSEASAETDHLRALRCMPMGMGQVGISAWSLRPGSRTVWTNTRFNGLLAGRKYLESLLGKLGAGSDPSTSARVEAGAAIRYPVLTYSLVATIAVLFVLQLVLGEFHGLLAPSVQSLVASGGLHRSLVVENGQWYRLVSAAFLHGDLFHLVLSDIALFLGGVVLESLLGRSWLLMIFGLSILGGSAASLLINGPAMVSVGASGAIMGMLAAAFLVTVRLPYGQKRSSAQMQLLYWLVPALIPLATHGREGKIDFAAHLGGGNHRFRTRGLHPQELARN
jgi:rhomboid protease GluP